MIAWLTDLVALMLCPHCRRGVIVTQRSDTREFTHNIKTQAGPNIQTVQHTLCRAHKFRLWMQENF